MENLSTPVVFTPHFDNGYKAFYGNVLISSSRDLNIYEERFLALLVAKAAEQLRKYNHLTGYRFEPDKALCPQCIRFSPKELLYNSKNYNKARKACEEMASKTITFEIEQEDNTILTRIVHLTGPIDIKSSGKKEPSYIELKIEKELWRLLLDMSKGYSLIDMKYIFRLKKPASMRLLPLFFGISYSSSLKKEIPTYSIEKLKEMFAKEDNYRDNGAFIKKVIAPAITEIQQLNAPFYGKATVIRDSRDVITGIKFEKMINFDKVESSFPCLLSTNPVFRSNKIKEVFYHKYGWETIPKQVENIISFAQEYIEDDNELCNLVYDLQPKTRMSEKGPIAGFIVLMRSYLLKQYKVKYVAPSKGGNVLPQRIDTQHYTDWQLLKYRELELDAYEDERLKALLEAIKEHPGINFRKIQEYADSILDARQSTEQNEFSDAKVMYGISHLSDEEIYNNIQAGIIDDKNVIGVYDEDSYSRLNFMLSIILDFNKSEEEKTWEAVSAAIKDKFHQSGSSVSNVSPSSFEESNFLVLSSEEYGEMMNEHDRWVAAGMNIATVTVSEDSDKVNDLF